MGRIWGASGKGYSLCLFSNHIFPGVWEPENLMPASHLEVDRDRETAMGEPSFQKVIEKVGKFPISQIAWEVAGFQGCLLGASITFLGE